MRSDSNSAVPKRRTIRLKLRPAFSMILTLQALLICISSLVAVRVFHGKYRSLLYQQAVSILDTYAATCENRLDIVEKWSYNILSDQQLQEQMLTLDTTESNYTAYYAKYEAEKLLTNYLFTIDMADSIYYITNDGTQLIGQYLASGGGYSSQEASRWKELAESRNGSPIWTYSIEQEHLYLLRTIRSIKSGDFSNLGTLVISCPFSKVLYSEYQSDAGYSPVFCVADSETILFTRGLSGQEDAFFAQAGTDQPFGFLDTPLGRYYYAGKSSPSTGWDYVCSISDAKMLEEINTLTFQIVCVIILVLLLTLLLSAVLSGSILNRIHLLVERMDRMRNGQYDLPAKPKRTRYEIEEIVGLDKHFTSMAQEIDHLVNDVYAQELSLRDMRYQMLQNQINPHFIYNTLETINNIARCRGEQEISLMVLSLSHMLRSSLASSDLVSLREELGILKSYISIQKIRFEERLDFCADVPEDFLDIAIPKLTLQPLVENSINYGLERFSRVCSIRVTAHRVENGVEISIQDNGPGMKKDYIRRIFSGEIVPQRTGLGIKNVDERLKHSFGGQSGLYYESAPGHGCKVSFRLPENKEGRECPIA